MYRDFTGSKYNPAYTTKDIAKLMRKWLKENYPKYKFSVKSDYMHVEITLVETDFNNYAKTFEDLTDRDRARVRIEMIDHYGQIYPRTYEELAPEYLATHHYESKQRKELVEAIETELKSYERDNSDPMTDYFDVNFYYHVA